MLNSNDFSMEQLEARLEMLWLYVPYVTTCRTRILFVTVYYPCIKWKWIWV